MLQVKFCIFFILFQVYAHAASVDVMPEVSLQRNCFSCEGINCQKTSRSNVTVSCTNALDICVTIFDDFAVSAKGCYTDMPQAYRAKCDVRNNAECFKCFGQLCNNKGRADFKCIECDTKNNGKCAENAAEMMPVQCPIPTATNSYCFVREAQAGQITRGCYASLKEQMACMQDASCSMCLSSDAEACNSYRSERTQSSAARSTLFGSGAILAMILGYLLK